MVQVDNNITIDKLIEQLEQLYAIELLEYHDKNLLADDNKKRCELKLEKLKELIKNCESMGQINIISDSNTIKTNDDIYFYNNDYNSSGYSPIYNNSHSGECKCDSQKCNC